MTTAVAARDTPETTGTAPRRTHFAGFELLRAVSSILIVFHHAGALAGSARTGRASSVVEILDIGVSIFFVTSGFLIYRPLVAGHLDDRPEPLLRGFYWRRLLRVVPAYWFALTFFWVIGNYDLGRDWWRYYLLLQIYDRFTVLGGLVQAWTLATEVAFYLAVPLWALAMGSLVRRLGTRKQRFIAELAGCGFLWLVAIASRAAIDRFAPSKAGISFTWLPTNLDTFAWGMALAVISVEVAHHARWRERLDRIGNPVWLWWLAALVPFLWYAEQIGTTGDYVGWYWQRRQFTYLLVAVLAVVPVVFGNEDRGRTRKMWRTPTWVWLGTVSYGLYLWHFDWMKRAVSAYDMFFQRELWPGWFDTPPGDSNYLALLAVGLGVGLVFASVSWYFVEKPLSRYRNLVPVVRRSARPLDPEEFTGGFAGPGAPDRDEGALGDPGPQR